MHNLPPLSLPKLVGSEKNDEGVEKNGQAISGEEKQFQSETLPGNVKFPPIYQGKGSDPTLGIWLFY